MRILKGMIALFLLIIVAAEGEYPEKVRQISGKVQELCPYIQERTVAVKIIVGANAGFGSGAIVSSDGLIVTCAHVAEIAETLTVITSDGKQHRAKKLGMNSINDYALIRIEAKSLPFFELGDSSKLELLQWVIAAGHPGGPYPDSRPTITAGRIRGLHKKLPVQFGTKFYPDAIQTDLPIFSGNSGGPLIDMDGKLIGINAAITLVNDLGFSVPVGEIERDLPVLSKGRNVPGREPGNFFQIVEMLQDLQEDFSLEDMRRMLENSPLGKFLEFLDRDFASDLVARPKFGLTLRDDKQGRICVSLVQNNSIAQMAGFRRGDVVVKFEGEAIRSARHLERRLECVETGESVGFEVSRNGESLDIWATLDRRAYSRDSFLKKELASQGIDLADFTVKVYVDRKHAGYGVIISPTGEVLTSFRLVQNSKDIRVRLQTSDGEYPARIVGENGDWDLSLLRFDPGKSVKSIPMNESRPLQVGDWVISGGCKDGIVQAGMVGALRRYVPPSRKIPSLGIFGILGRTNKTPARAYIEAIQHDTPLESSQFGTPLIDEGGNLVGINSGHFYRGTAFAIPLSAIQEALPQMRAGQRIPVSVANRAYQPSVDPIGKALERFRKTEPLDPESLKELLEGIWGDLTEEAPKKGGFLGIEAKQHWQGVEVVSVSSGQAASKSGICAGDVITDLDKQKVHSLVSLLEMLENMTPETTVEITVLRQDQERRMRVVLGRRQ